MIRQPDWIFAETEKQVPSQSTGAGNENRTGKTDKAPGSEKQTFPAASASNVIIAIGFMQTCSLMLR